MLGAIIGDIVGSRFEFNPTNDYNFELFNGDCNFTDDTICTVAIADALLHKESASIDYGKSLHDWCRRFPHPKGGYGGRFREWVMSNHPKPYNSFGNGSAMRVSPIAWAFRNIKGAINAAEKSAACTHNHPEGIKGAQAVVKAIHYGDDLRRRCGDDQIELLRVFKHMINNYGYDINIRREDVLNKFDETCQGTVPVALWIVSESKGFEDAIRKAVCLGADADTLGAIVGSIAEAIWGVPSELAHRAMEYLPAEMQSVVLNFYKRYCWEICPIKDNEEEEEKKNQLFAVMRWKLGLGNFNHLITGGDGLPKKDKVATADSWNILPMPDGENEVSRLETDIEITQVQLDILRKGHIPEVQEDHWFMYCTDDCIRYYRSWTGTCCFEAFYHERNHRIVIDHLNINRTLCEFGVNGDISGEALFVYLITEETGGYEESAWQSYIIAWEEIDEKYSKKKNEDKIVDSWFTGTENKICDGCIYKGGIRRMNDSLSNEIMGCGRCGRETFETNYLSGKCQYRKTDLFTPSQFEIEAKAATLRRIKEKKRMEAEKEKAFEKEIRAYVPLKKTYAAGTQFVKDKKALWWLEKYAKLELVREFDNIYDENAVSLHYQSKHVGYVPRKENKEIAAMLEAGMYNRIVTFVTAITTTKKHTTYEISIYLTVE